MPPPPRYGAENSSQKVGQAFLYLGPSGGSKVSRLKLLGANEVPGSPGFSIVSLAFVWSSIALCSVLFLGILYHRCGIAGSKTRWPPGVKGFPKEVLSHSEPQSRRQGSN